MSAAGAFALVIFNAVLLYTSNFPGQGMNAAAPGLDFTDFLVVTGAPIFLWVIGFNTYAVWNIRNQSVRIAQLLESREIKDWRRDRPDHRHAQDYNHRAA